MRRNNRDGFTLIELLTVIGILAVLATATALIINPVDMLAQGRDSNRVDDINSINDAFQIYELRNQNPIPLINTLYISLPDSSPACLSYTLPPLSSGWQYACAPASSHRNVDGTGWIPVNFSGFTTIKFDRLPIDPKNNTTHFYAYTPGRILTTAFESTKFMRDFGDRDGGNDPLRYEVGNFDLWSNAAGLVGYWTLNEGLGLSVADSSTNANTGSLVNGPTWFTEADCRDGNCLSFDGNDDYVSVSSSSSLSAIFGSSNKVFTLSAWARPTAWVNWSAIVNKANSGYWSNSTVGLWSSSDSGFTCVVGSNTENNPPGWGVQISHRPSLDSWHHIACASDGSVLRIYVDGQERGSASIPGTANPTSNSAPLTIGRRCAACIPSFLGRIDEVRVYNRRLSAYEILSIYNTNR